MIYWGWNASLNSQGKKSTGLIKCLISREKSHVSVTHSNYRVCSLHRPALEVSSMRCLILVDKRTTLGALISDIPCLAQSVHSEITKTRHVTEDQKKHVARVLGDTNTDGAWAATLQQHCGDIIQFKLSLIMFHKIHLSLVKVVTGCSSTFWTIFNHI